jgi:hypothetical protein
VLFASPRDAKAAATMLVHEKTTKKGYLEIKRAAPKAIVDARVVTYVSGR